jgi:hypothetical protein
MRLGKTCASGPAAAGAAGVALGFLVSGPNLRPHQWLALLLIMQLLLLGMWACVWMVGRTLQLGGFFANVVAPAAILVEVGQIIYTWVAFPGQPVAEQSPGWWWLVADGIGWAIVAVLVRELFFGEYLERFPPPATLGPAIRAPIQAERASRLRPPKTAKATGSALNIVSRRSRRSDFTSADIRSSRSWPTRVCPFRRSETTSVTRQRSWSTDTGINSTDSRRARETGSTRTSRAPLAREPARTPRRCPCMSHGQPERR